MQRLFSTFPSGRPGAGLLLLRLAAGGSLIVGGMLPMMGAIPHSLGLEVRIALVCVGIFLLGGLWTPVMGSAAAIIELLITFSHMVDNATHIVLAILGLSLALLGPGAWSIDARIFGRKRIDIDVG